MKKTHYGKSLGVFLMGIFLINLVAGISLVSLSSASSSTSTEKTSTNLILDFDETKVDTTLRPGDSGVLQIVIKNTGKQPAEKVVVRLYDTAKIKAQGRFGLGTIDGETSKTISKVIKIESDATPGLYTLSVVAIFDSLDSNGRRTDDVERRWEIPIRIYGNPNFQLFLKDAEFFKDVKQKLTLKGLTRAVAKETSATLSSTCVTIIGSNKKYIGDLFQDQGFTLEYQIKPSSTGSCTLIFTLEYLDISGASTKEELSLGIDVQPSDINFNIMDVVPDTLTYGHIDNLTIYIVNLGPSSATDVTAKLNLDEDKPFTVLKTSEKYLGDVASKETKEVKFEILADSDAEKRAYMLSLTLEYYDASGTKKTVEKNIGIQVSGKPEISPVLESSDSFTKGSKGKVSINVINSAFTNVKFLTIKLISTEEYNVISSNEVYIGNLDSDDSDSEEFEIQLSKNVNPGIIYLQVELRYKEEGSNIENVETKRVPLTVLSPNEYAKVRPSGVTTTIFSFVGLIVGGFIFIVVLWLLYRLLRLVIAYLDKKIFKKRKII